MPCRPLQARNTVNLSCTDANVMMTTGALSMALSNRPDGICQCTFYTCTRLATFNLSSSSICTNSISYFEVSPLLMVNPMTRMFASLALTRSTSVARSTLLATSSTFLPTTYFHFSPLSYMVSKLLTISSTLFCNVLTWPITVTILASIAKAIMFSATCSIVTQ